MDWADDITYSVHDIDDFYRAGRIPVDALTAGIKSVPERERFLDSVFSRRGDDPDFADEGSLRRAFTDVLITNFSISEPYTGSARQRAQLRQFCGNELDGISTEQASSTRTVFGV